MAHTRRQFIKRGVTFVGASLLAPRVLLGSGAGVARARTPGGSRLLLIVEMAGGNDGLNTVVPFADPLYYSNRPTLAIPRASAIPLTDATGLHPSMAGLKALYDEGLVAVVQGVGYPNPDYSHFRSTEIWQTAAPDTFATTGWLGRYLDATSPAGSLELDAIAIGYETPVTLSTASAATVASIDSFQSYQFDLDGVQPQDEPNKRRAFVGLYDDLRGNGETLDFLASTGLAAYSSSQVIQDATASYTPAVEYPNDPFSRSLLMVAQLVGANLGTDIYYTSLGSFDTHARQAADHAQLLGWFSDGITAFYRDMLAHGLSDDLLILTFSEFGRRVRENESAGTDHGAAGPLFVIGDPVRGGVYGDHPSLADLDDYGNLKHTTDFRSVYATVLRHWLDTDPATVLGDDFPDIGFL